MQTINIHTAKTHLSKFLEIVAHGEEVTIAKAGKPIAKLCPISPKKPKRKLGLLKGKIKIAKDFDDPLPNSILADFEGEE